MQTSPFSSLTELEELQTSRSPRKLELLIISLLIIFLRVYYYNYGIRSNFGSRTTQKNIKKRAKKSKGQGSTSAKVSVGTNKKNFHAAIAAEFGTEKQTPKPFIRLALEKNWQKSASIFAYALKKRIQQQAKRLAKHAIK